MWKRTYKNTDSLELTYKDYNVVLNLPKSKINDDLNPLKNLCSDFHEDSYIKKLEELNNIDLIKTSPHAYFGDDSHNVYYFSIKNIEIPLILQICEKKNETHINIEYMFTSFEIEKRTIIFPLNYINNKTITYHFTNKNIPHNVSNAEFEELINILSLYYDVQHTECTYHFKSRVNYIDNFTIETVISPEKVLYYLI